ncbi:MAG TPA: BlaI/MecI/CopY family transcriptional regulator [Thermoleophilia bacterium]|nr:BlaI/MecI/CopY family transcriptional regulator [Thermoleophilia bacterium]HZK49559.1 BlaI/MecI/CopY family transcriptional regulator [Thermoleophilia bacterium]
MDHTINLNTGNQGLRQVLGELEAEIMECMWEFGSASVREVHECLAEKREIAYTTVMTVMSRLAEKGMLRRSQEGRAYVYVPVETRDAFCTSVVKRVLDGLFAGAGKPVLAHFVENLTEADSAELDGLAQVIEEKRRERSSSAPQQ